MKRILIRREWTVFNDVKEEEPSLPAHDDERLASLASTSGGSNTEHKAPRAPDSMHGKDSCAVANHRLSQICLLRISKGTVSSIC